MTPRARQRATALGAVAVILGMAGLTAASVPLYDLFCRVTGYGGTPTIDPDARAEANGARVSVSFNADVDPELPWSFHPQQRRLEVPLGEQHLAFYEAVNNSDAPVVGRAVYNVAPFKVGSYFTKIACFCFEEQVLEPGQRVEMPVSFFVDPTMLDDRDARDVREITLSYTFFIDGEATAELLKRRGATPAS